MNDPLTTSASAQAAACVYFDGACPVCRAEIDVYRRTDGADQIEFVDIAAPGAVLPRDVSRETLLKRFYVRTNAGELRSGARGFVALWQSLPKFRRLGRIAGWPPITALLEIGYRVFLRIRPLWRRT
jgi:predicted DCC family thiol-disulfide oxidoreductase YuxK